jgi:hypothetical protein
MLNLDPLPNPPPFRGRERSGILAALLVFVALIVFAPFAQAQQPRTFTPTDETPEDLPAGHGREETFYACTACHGFKIVAQQGLTRSQWDDSLNWMTTKHGMNAIEGDDRKVILDYLEKNFAPRSKPGRGSPNPFL